MRVPTARALAEINRRFYEARAADFSATRERPWPGWETCLRHRPRDRTETTLRVLDVGCGNGRLARFLADRGVRPLHYRGVDASPGLLALARERLAGCGLARLELEHADWMEPDFEARLGDAAWDQVTAFGVLHHVPGRARREALAGQLARRVAPGGFLIVTAWRAEGLGELARRALPWERCQERTGVAVDAGDLEPGDALLPWKHDAEVARYCHFPDPAETEAWIEATGLPVREDFLSDGPSGAANRYLVLGPGG